MKISGIENETHSDSFGISSVGAWLKVSREDRGITLDEVAKVTRIGKNYLEAIEEGELGKLPSQAYTRGFIRLYALHLGLSPDKALAMMTVSPADSTATFTDPLSGPKQFRRSQPAYSRILIVIATLSLALVSGYLLLKPTKESRTPIQSNRAETLPAGQTLNAVPTQQEKSPPSINEPLPSPPSQQEQGEIQGIVLRLKAVSDGKIHITIDGSVSQAYDLVTGDLVEWKAENSFMLDLDNAAAFEGELDGVKLDPFGEKGRAAHLILKADGIHKD